MSGRIRCYLSLSVMLSHEALAILVDLLAMAVSPEGSVLGYVHRKRSTSSGGGLESLGGSSKHVTGHHGASSTYSRSTTPAIVRWLLAGLADARPPVLWGEPSSEEQEVLSAVGIALHYLRPPTQALRFLANALLSGALPGLEHTTGLPTARVVLGTPLFVSLVGVPQEENRYGLDAHW
jgi:hypothetical protein